MELLDRVAIVTGASRGIGRQLALALARHGTKVVVAARTVEPHARLVGSVGETVAPATSPIPSSSTRSWRPPSHISVASTSS